MFVINVKTFVFKVSRLISEKCINCSDYHRRIILKYLERGVRKIFFTFNSVIGTFVNFNNCVLLDYYVSYLFLYACLVIEMKPFVSKPTKIKL